MKEYAQPVVAICECGQAVGQKGRVGHEHITVKGWHYAGTAGSRRLEKVVIHGRPRLPVTTSRQVHLEIGAMRRHIQVHPSV